MRLISLADLVTLMHSEKCFIVDYLYLMSNNQYSPCLLVFFRLFGKQNTKSAQINQDLQHKEDLWESSFFWTALLFKTRRRFCTALYFVSKFVVAQKELNRCVCIRRSAFELIKNIFPVSWLRDNFLPTKWNLILRIIRIFFTRIYLEWGWIMSIVNCRQGEQGEEFSIVITEVTLNYFWL